MVTIGEEWISEDSPKEETAVRSRSRDRRPRGTTSELGRPSPPSTPRPPAACKTPRGPDLEG